MNTIAVRTILPILLLIGTGYLSRKINILKAGDERVLNAFVYYFALPALFFINMSELRFTLATYIFAVAAFVPVFTVVAIYLLLYWIIGFSRDRLYLLITCTVFGSHAFFGIPFIVFAFPTIQGEQLAILSASSISIVGVSISLTVLEFYKLGSVKIWEGIKQVAKRLSKNPLILSIFLGFLFSLFHVEVPHAFSTFLHMLGKTTATVAIFMLGVFLYGRTYSKIGEAFKLSLLRIIVLPVIGLIAMKIFGFHGIERSVLVLMYSMPLALSMIVLSERYNFHVETIASVIMISSLAAGLYLNVWLWIVQ
jgi:malonate transporter